MHFPSPAIFSQNLRVIGYFMPRRRFSQGAVEALRQVLGLTSRRELLSYQLSLPSDDLEATNSAGTSAARESLMMDPEDFAGLSREEQLKVLEGKSWVKNIDFNQSFAELHSLTGGKKAKWKFQDSFYGNFNVGRRPSQDTAWGRR